MDLHVLTVRRVDGGGVAVPPQHDDGGQHVERGVELQKNDTQKKHGYIIAAAVWRHRARGSTYSESKRRSAVSHDGNSWRENTNMLLLLCKQTRCVGFV